MSGLKTTVAEIVINTQLFYDITRVKTHEASIDLRKIQLFNFFVY